MTSFTLTHQWVRELRRWHPGVLVAVHVRLKDDTPVTVGRYGAVPKPLSAAQAGELVRGLADPRGYEVFVPRAITANEVRRVRRIPPGIGWRYLPGAHGRAPCACPVCLAPGTPGAVKIRRRFSQDEPGRTKPELMAALHAAASEEIIDALWALSGKRRGGREELEYLAENPCQATHDTARRSLTRIKRCRAGQEKSGSSYHWVECGDDHGPAVV